MDNINYNEILIDFINDNSLNYDQIDYLYNLAEFSNDDIRAFILHGNISILDGMDYSLDKKDIEQLALALHRYNLRKNSKKLKLKE